MKTYICIALQVVLFLSCKSNTSLDSGFAAYVNPFIGATTSVDAAGIFHGLGKTFPGATTPYGMAQVSPNTITGGDNGSGYSYEHKTIEGFAMTQMSGVGWYGDLGNFLIMPSNGELRLTAGRENDDRIKGWRSEYDKSTEKASAGYYSADLTDYGIKTECTASPHGGVLRFTFPENNLSRIQIDLARRVGGTSVEQYIQVVDEHTIKGWMKCTPDGGGWGNGDGQANYTVYFYAVFDKALRDYGFWSADIPDGCVRRRDEVTGYDYQKKVSQSQITRNVSEMQGKHLGFFSEFPTVQGEQVELKVGISFVDTEGAQKNYMAELNNKSFNQIHKEAVELWNKALSVISVETKSRDTKTIFYTALYHTMIDPRIVSDVDGRYCGANGKIYKEDGFKKRTIFSGWDVFRSQFPLQTIINPQLTNDVINSLTTLAEQSGREYFERWEFFNAYTGCMLGNPALSVLADAYVKGIRDYDIQKAYQYAKKSSEKFPASSSSISETLEYAYFDWCVYVLADALGKADEAACYLAKSKNWQSLYNKEQNWFQPKDVNGDWIPFPSTGRLSQDFGCVESNPYQQGWFVPHDIEGMIEMMGGREVVKNDLIAMFSKTPSDYSWNDYYNHANEPVHFIPFLFNRIGEPSLTQYWTRNICANAYHNSVEGLCGNEDVGQMSAWYILASIGLHPVCPGETSFELTSPVFDKVTINLSNGKRFIIDAIDNNHKNVYISLAKLNGSIFNIRQIEYKDIISGGKLELYMSSR